MLAGPVFFHFAPIPSNRAVHVYFFGLGVSLLSKRGISMESDLVRVGRQIINILMVLLLKNF